MTSRFNASTIVQAGIGFMRGWTLVVCAAVFLSVSGPTDVAAQIEYSRGQNIAPAFEGWESNADGTFDLVFGYMNRNYEEHLYMPVGPNNQFEPGAPDQGQPTYFLPRRNRHVFRVRVPRDFGQKELVWTITANGVSEKVYASLKPDYALDARVRYLNNTGLTMRGKAEQNEPPVVSVDGGTMRTVEVGAQLHLTATARDDGIPAPKPAPEGAVGFRTAVGLRVAWFVYRGNGTTVSFDPEQFEVYPDFLGNSPWRPGWLPPPVPADGKFPVAVTFGEPGTYMLRVMAHDGGFEATEDVTVTVRAAGRPGRSSASAAPVRR
jgi:hypothetical protein